MHQPTTNDFEPDGPVAETTPGDAPFEFAYKSIHDYPPDVLREFAHDAAPAPARGAARRWASEARDESLGFWPRQFAGRATRAQVAFDVIAGVAAPLLCLAFDPTVFRGGVTGAPVLGEFRLFAYSVIAIEITTLLAWLALGERARAWAGLLAGGMLAGAVFSLAVGLAILPFSLAGLVILIGVFGFTPFLTALVFLRNGRRALREARLAGSDTAAALALGAVLAISIPLVVQRQTARAVERSVRELSAADGARAEAATRRLGRVHSLTGEGLDELAWAYARQADPARKLRLARAYRDITGLEVEHRLLVLND